MKHKKLILIILLLSAACIYFYFKNHRPVGKTENAEITIGDSAKFSRAEIESAMDTVKLFFKDFKGCELKRLWYDEESAEVDINGYLSYGSGAVNGTDAADVIILYSDFYVDYFGADVGFNPNPHTKVGCGHSLRMIIQAVGFWIPTDISEN